MNMFNYKNKMITKLMTNNCYLFIYKNNFNQ